MSKLNFTVLYKGNVYGHSVTLNGANTIIGNLLKMEQYKFEDFKIIDYVAQVFEFRKQIRIITHNKNLTTTI